MRMPMPDWHFAQLAAEVWGEDGVRGKVGFDPEQGWYTELDDSDFEQYLKNLRRRSHEILETFASTWHKETKNIQIGAMEPPAEDENRLAIYLIDCDCQTTRGFQIKNSLRDIWELKTAFVALGSTCEHCGRKMMVVLTWEDVKPGNAKPN